MKPVRLNRLRVEFDRWRLVWQEVETFLDRVEGCRADDAPHQARSAALHDAAIALERLRLRRDRKWLPPGLRVQSSGSPAIAEAFSARKYELPGPLDIEIAAARAAAKNFATANASTPARTPTIAVRPRKR
jgi:hypothetical protein